MQRTVESVAQFGVLAPLIARPREEGGYEIISGHRRQHAAELAGLTTLPVIVRNMSDDEDMLREMLELLVDTVCSKRRFIRIAGDDKPAEVVKAQLMKLNSDHLRFVLMCLKENTTQVRNMRQYLLATLYNAPMTMHSSYAARVQHDFKTG